MHYAIYIKSYKQTIILSPKYFPSFYTVIQDSKIQFKAPVVIHENLDLEILVWLQLSLGIVIYTNGKWKTKKIPLFRKKKPTPVSKAQPNNTAYSPTLLFSLVHNVATPTMQQTSEKKKYCWNKSSEQLLSSRSHSLGYTCKTSQVSQRLSAVFPASSHRWEKRLPQHTATESPWVKAVAG